MAFREGRRRPASGSVIVPSSCIWQMISLASYQICRLPGDLAGRTVLAATSLTASVRSIARASVSPARIAYRCTTARIAARSVMYVYDTGLCPEGDDGSKRPLPPGRGTGGPGSGSCAAGTRCAVLPSRAISKHDTPAREKDRENEPPHGGVADEAILAYGLVWGAVG